MTKRYEITRAAELGTLPVFRNFVDHVCHETQLDHDINLSLKLAIDEACTNIIEHGYAGMNPGSIILTLMIAPTQVIVEITDFGHPFAPYEPEEPDAEAIMEDQDAGGFGLYIIYQTMDQIDYSPSTLGNRLIFTKRLG